MIIDFHEHLYDRKGYVDKLVRECKRLGIDKVCISGLGRHHGMLGNDGVKEAFTKYPDVITGFGYIRLGVDNVATVDTLYEKGFKGLKVIRPPANYDDKQFYPIYARAQDYGMPILFHLGILARREDEASFDVSFNRMRPAYLDTIARAFPKLTLVGAHLGNPWYEEACEVARWNPNVYFDLSGSTLKKKKPSFFKEILWWTGKQTFHYEGLGGKGPFEKIVFGGDVPCELIEDVLNDYRKLLDDLKVPKKIQHKVFGGTVADILNL
ncbi:hypothetical protein ES702_01525 [subsurface metagenome]